ncbi:hypothetical protein I4U23_022832 [Adineta vaga]|nr:hypothetical protein I4U23_022832 [Adineta vaga]
MNRAEAMLDDYHIDIKNMVQISNNSLNKQRPVKRMDDKNGELRLRPERFMPNPIFPAAPFLDELDHRGGSFLRKVMVYLEVTDVSFPLRQSGIRRKVVEAAVDDGLIVEGKKMGQQKIGEWLAGQLREVTTGTEKEVGACCARLYCMQSFLFEKLNEVMRLVGDQQHVNFVKSKVSTHGPFALLLWRVAEYDRKQPKFSTIYRGANLSDNLIDQYREKCVGTTPYTSDKTFIFPAYTSTTLNRDKAEQYGNVLFIIVNGRSSGWDMTPYSLFYYEEEVLLRPYFRFNIVSCEFDDTKDKWIIHLTSCGY